jgi:hypothetical protein
MNVSSLPYLPGSFPPRQGPLSRYLPSIPEGEATSWLEQHLPQKYASAHNLWVLDPFGASPYLPVEIARAGYQVLVTANNPIIRFLIELAANPPSRDDFTLALADLASIRRGEDRLEPYIQSLYSTQCNYCAARITAKGFVWERGTERESPRLISKIYDCPNCMKEGEFPVTQEDIAALEQFAHLGLYQSRALERVVSYEDPVRSHVEEALAVYLPRSLYALITLINKKDSLTIKSTRMSTIDAILLSAFDLSNSLWAYPISRSRPRQLTIPAKFHETNIWVALEESIDDWTASSSHQPSIATTTWPDLPSSAGICIYEGRLKDLIANLKAINFGAVVSVLPRPNQAFWSLCAIWAGWLWGRESARSIKSVLQRRRYDWGWHAKALQAVFSDLHSGLDSNIPFFSLIGELETGFLNAAFVAADLAGFEFTGLAIRPESNQAQINWLATKNTNQTGHPKPEKSQPESPILNIIENFQTKIQQGVINYLCERGAPALYSHVHAASLVCMVTPSGESIGGGNFTSLPKILFDTHKNIAEIPGQINNLIEASLISRKGLMRFAGSEKSIEVGQWWLIDPIADSLEIQAPLYDRIETAVVDYLTSHPGASLQEIDRSLCDSFPGLLTPSPELIQICLESYGQSITSDSGKWNLRPEDESEARQSELSKLNSLLDEISNRLGYLSEGQSPTLWRSPAGEIVFVWYILTTALFSRIILNSTYPLDKILILLPGGRANLVAYKLNHDGRLNQAIHQGLRIIKFRQIRQMAHSAVLYPQLFKEQLQVDTITYNAPQMRLF